MSTPRYNHMYSVKGWDPVVFPVLEAKRGTIDQNAMFKESPNFAQPVKRRREESGWLIQTFTSAKKRAKKWFFVPEAEYRRPKIKDRFLSKHLVTPDKFVRNCSVVHYMAQYSRPNRNVVVLDSPSTQTVSLLRRAGVDRIVVANPDETFLKHAPADFPRDQLFSGTMMEFIRNRRDKAEYDVLADYCCTFKGDGIRNCPREDLTELFKRGVLARHNGLLWLTFSTRGCNPDATMSTVRAFVATTAATSGYSLKLLESDFYSSRRMMFLYFVSC